MLVYGQARSGMRASKECIVKTAMLWTVDITFIFQLNVSRQAVAGTVPAL